MEAEVSLNTLKDKVLAGEDVPPEEYRRVLNLVRQDRMYAAETAMAKKTAKKPKAPKTPVDLNKLLEDF